MMAKDLYQEALLTKARSATGAGTLGERADSRVTVDNPLCGDRITLELSRDGDRVGAIAHKVRGCILCQAAAALIAELAPGQTRDDLIAAKEAARSLLAGGVPPAGAWTGLAIFTPVATHKSRHQCVLLPFEALRRALDEAGL